MSPLLCSIHRLWSAWLNWYQWSQSLGPLGADNTQAIEAPPTCSCAIYMHPSGQPETTGHDEYGHPPNSSAPSTERAPLLPASPARPQHVPTPHPSPLSAPLLPVRRFRDTACPTAAKSPVRPSVYSVCVWARVCIQSDRGCHRVKRLEGPWRGEWGVAQSDS